MDNKHFNTGDALINVINAHIGTPTRKFNRRDFVEPLINFCTDNDFSAKIGIVYGLRATGKTVGMLQAAEELLSQGCKVAYARFNYNETDIKAANDEILQLANKGVTHFLVDEASYLEGFLNNAAEWADMLVPRHRIKIIISGTDSFLIWTAQRKSLFHRFEEFPTNWNSYPEYATVMQKPYDNFKREGGIFTKDNMPDFIQSAVVDNLLHTIEHCMDDAGRTTFYTDYLYGIDETVIYKAVISILKCVAEDTIKKHFVEHAGKMNISDLGDAIRGLTAMEKRDIKTRVAESMDLYRKFTPINRPLDVINALIEFLVKIGCLTKYSSGTNEFGDKESLAFTHNALMNYAAEETIRGIRSTKNINESIFDESIRQAIEGALNENVVLAHILQTVESGTEVFKYRDADFREVDAVIINREAKTVRLIEVKSKSSVDNKYVFDNEARHLFDGNVLKNIGVSNDFTVTRVLVFRGKTALVCQKEKKLFLVNIEDLLREYRNINRFLDGFEKRVEKETSEKVQAIPKQNPPRKTLLEKINERKKKADKQPSPTKKPKSKNER